MSRYKHKLPSTARISPRTISGKYTKKMEMREKILFFFFLKTRYISYYPISAHGAIQSCRSGIACCISNLKKINLKMRPSSHQLLLWQSIPLVLLDLALLLPVFYNTWHGFLKTLYLQGLSLGLC